MKRRILCLLLVLALLCGTVFAAGTKSPYAIRVNRALNTVTVYEQDENGDYTVPVKAMICSTARPGYVTPLGTYTLGSYRSEWRLMLDGSYGQYACGFYGNYLFHSVCYSSQSHDSLLYEEYNNLGGPASMGCVRLQVADAKWIYDNCPGGTQVTVYEDWDSPGPLGKPDKQVDEITPETNNGWDPTDPAAGNPWTMVPATGLTLEAETLNLTAGESALLTARVEPQEATNRNVTWTSSDSNTAAVDARGCVTAMGQGTAVITASCRDGFTAACTVTVAGSLLPYGDLVPGAWYYSDVRAALEKNLFQGSGGETFLPDAPMTRAMLVQTLYNKAGRPKVTDVSPFLDVAEGDWYHDAVVWAYGKGYATGLSEDTFAPMSPLTREQLAALLWRYAGSPGASGSLNGFSDQAKASAYARTALLWMTEKGYLQGSGGKLSPRATATRAQTAAILNRIFA